MDTEDDNPLREAVRRTQDAGLIPEQAIELYDQGKRIAARKLLQAHQRKEKDETRRAIQEELLERRGIWLDELSSAPSLFTLNGFGLRMAGRHDEDEDGYYVKTHYLSALFIPLVPLGSYVVRDADDGGWSFYARGPMPPRARVQRAAMLGLGGLGVLGLIANGVIASTESHLIIVNGFDQPLSIDLDGEELAVGARSFAVVDTRVTVEHHVTASLSRSGTIVDELDIAGAGWGMDIVVNPGCRAILSQGWVRWGDGDPPDTQTLWTGPVSQVESVAYIFEEPEDTRYVEDDSYEQEAWLDASYDDAGEHPLEDLGVLQEFGADPVFTERFAAAALHDHPDDERLLQVVASQVEDELAFLEGHVQRFPGAVHGHRLLQSRLPEDEAIERYDALLAEHPDDPMYHYLAGRLREGEASRSFLDRALQLDPDFSPAYRGLHFLAWEALDFERSWQLATKLIELEPDESEWRVRALRAGMAQQRPTEELRRVLGPREFGFDLATLLELSTRPERANTLAGRIFEEFSTQEGYDPHSVPVLVAWFTGDLETLDRLFDKDDPPAIPSIAVRWALSRGRSAWFAESYPLWESGGPDDVLAWHAYQEAGKVDVAEAMLESSPELLELLRAPDSVEVSKLARYGGGYEQVLAWVLARRVQDEDTRAALLVRAGTALPWQLPRTEEASPPVD